MASYEEAPSTGGCLRPLMAVSFLLPLFFISGSVLGQTAGMLSQLMAEDSVIKINEDQATWIASVLAIGTCIGACVSGFLSDRFGRIRLCQVTALSFGIGYAIMLAAKSIMLLVLGRFVLGLGFGSVNVCFVYVSEVVPPAHRGMLLSLCPLLSSIGVVYMYIVGGYLPWKAAAGIVCLLDILVIVLTLFWCDSPVWLVRNNKINAAKKSLRRIEGLTNIETRLNELRKIADNQPVTEFRLGVFTEPTVWKPFIMLIVMSVLQNTGGLYIVIAYSVQFMHEFHSMYDPLQITIAVGIVRLLGVSLSSYLLRRVGRKTIGATSGFSSAALFLFVFAYLKLQGNALNLYENSWMGIGLFLVSLWTMSMGMFPLPWTMTFEVFPLKVRGMMCGVSWSTMFVVHFVVLKAFYTLLDSLKLEGMILMFAVSSLFFGLFSLIILVETHNKTLEEIEAEFANHKTNGSKDFLGQGTLLEEPQAERYNFTGEKRLVDPDE